MVEVRDIHKVVGSADMYIASIASGNNFIPNDTEE